MLYNVHVMMWRQRPLWTHYKSFSNWISSTGYCRDEQIKPWDKMSLGLRLQRFPLVRGLRLVRTGSPDKSRRITAAFYGCEIVKEVVRYSGTIFFELLGGMHLRFVLGFSCFTYNEAIVMQLFGLVGTFLIEDLGCLDLVKVYRNNHGGFNLFGL